jgi:hypothetical protein
VETVARHRADVVKLPTDRNGTARFCEPSEFAYFLFFIPSESGSEPIVFREIACITGELDIRQNMVAAVHKCQLMVQNEIQDY